MTDRKYVSEFGLNMVAGWRMVLQQDQLGAVDEAGIDPHIYLICRRPRIGVDPGSFKFTSERVTGCFTKQVKEKVLRIPLDGRNNFGYADLEVISDYPNSQFKIARTGGEVLISGKSAVLMHSLGPKYAEHLGLEVLYVGQAYGADGSRTAADRLRAHETLQGIYSEAMQQNPDQDVWLVLCTFEPFIIANFDGRRGIEASASPDEDTRHLHAVANAEVSEQQAINFTEAALIKYFQAPYNKSYKKRFPSPAHKTYTQCYDLDLNFVSAEISTDDLGCQLWSPAAEADWVHVCSFPLHSRNDRVYIFEIDW